MKQEGIAHSLSCCYELLKQSRIGARLQIQNGIFVHSVMRVVMPEESRPHAKSRSGRSGRFTGDVVT